MISLSPAFLDITQYLGKGKNRGSAYLSAIYHDASDHVGGVHAYIPST